MTDQVTINGKQYPYRLSYKALKQVSSLSAKGEIGIDSAEHALYWALKSGHQKENQEFTFEMKDMEEILEENFDLFIKVQKDMTAMTDKINGGNEPGK